MKQTRYRLAIPFRAPYRTSTGTLDERELLVVRLEDDDGIVGWGEGAPLGPLGPTETLAAEEMALLDLEARRAGRPAVSPLGADAVAVNMTLPAAPVADLAAAAAAGAAAGYDCFKVKVGVGDDVERVSAVRDAIGPDALIRLDANGAWRPEEAIGHLDRLSGLGIELVEQPCASLAELAEVRFAAGVPIAADESVRTVADLLAAADHGACDQVCVKISPAGGVAAARELIAAARSHGIEPYVSSALDGPLGIAAGLQLASAEAIERHCGLATLELFDSPLTALLPPPTGGRMAVPPGPGLGIDPGDDLPEAPEGDSPLRGSF